MNNKTIVAGIVGGVVAILMGFLLYGLALADFFQSNMGSATGVNRPDDGLLWGPMIIGHLAFGFMFAYIFSRWANISTFKTGAEAGAVIGFLMSLAWSMIGYGTTNVMNLTASITQVVVDTVLCAIVGGAVGYMLGRAK